MQIAVSPLRRLEPANGPLETPVWVIEDEFDWRHPLGGSPGGRSAVADKRGKFPAQRWMQVLHKSQGDAAAFAWRQAQSRIRPDGELDATADHLIIAAGMGPAVAPSDQRIAGPGIGLGSGSEDYGQAWRWRVAVAVGGSASIVLLPSHTRSKPQSGEVLNSPELTATCPD